MMIIIFWRSSNCNPHWGPQLHNRDQASYQIILAHVTFKNPPLPIVKTPPNYTLRQDHVTVIRTSETRISPVLLNTQSACHIKRHHAQDHHGHHDLVQVIPWWWKCWSPTGRWSHEKPSEKANVPNLLKPKARELPKIDIGRHSLSLNLKTLHQPQNPLPGWEDANLRDVYVACFLPWMIAYSLYIRFNINIVVLMFSLSPTSYLFGPLIFVASFWNFLQARQNKKQIIWHFSLPSAIEYISPTICPT